jgi:hypothetical protein
MIIGRSLGEVPLSTRLPFKPPGGFDRPRQIKTGFKTHLNPFWRIMNPYYVQQPRVPAFQTAANPIPPVATAPANAPVSGWGYFGADEPAVTVPTPSAPAMKGRRHTHINSGNQDPYAVMRSGRWPGINPNVANTHVGVQSAAQLVKRLTPFGYKNVNVPAGSYRY